VSSYQEVSQKMILVAKSFFVLGISNIQAQDEQHF